MFSSKDPSRTEAPRKTDRLQTGGVTTAEIGSREPANFKRNEAYGLQGPQRNRGTQRDGPPPDNDPGTLMELEGPEKTSKGLS